MSETKFVTLRELAQAIRLPARWLRREAEAGRIPCLHAGRRRMFDPAAVLNALTDRQAKGGAK